MRSRHRLSKFLLRRGRSYAAGRKHWTAAHHAWLQQCAFDDPVELSVFDEYRLAVAQLDARIEALDRLTPNETPNLVSCLGSSISNS